jgi:hypothetical protein
VRLGEVEDVEVDVQVDPRRSRRDRPHRPGEPAQLRRPQVRDRRRLEPCDLGRVEAPRPRQDDGILAHGAGAGHRAEHALPRATRQHRETHPVEVALGRRLGAVEVRVRVEPDHARVGLPQPGHHADSGEAAPGEDDWKLAGGHRGAHLLGHAPDQLEAGVHLPDARGIPRCVDLDELGAHRPAGFRECGLRSCLEQALGPPADAVAQAAELVGDDDQAVGGHGCLPYGASALAGCAS